MEGSSGLTVVLALILAFAVTTNAKHWPGTKAYAVLLNNLPPAAAYSGTHENFLSTAPEPGQKLDSGLPHVQLYVNHLVSVHNQLLQGVGVDADRKLYSYKYTLNAFAAALSPSEAVLLRAHPEIASVVDNTHCFAHTTHTPDFLNIPNSLWKGAGGKEKAGEDIIIGVIDTGITPDHPSFSDKFGDPYSDIHLSKSWRGSCDLVDPAFACNLKLIGAKFYVAGLLAGNDTVDSSSDLYSPRDFNGHGTHTASTAGGNNGVPVEGISPGVEYGAISGMAPRARIAAYKGLWTSGTLYPGSDYGTAVDLLAALDDAVSDGVDVINYSIGPSNDFFDIWALGVLYAARAGVFVSASAGNEGPEPVTLSHVAPWYLSVAASTHDREYVREVRLGNGEVYSGQALYAPPLAPSTSSSPFSILGGQQPAGMQMGLEEAVELVWGGAAVAPGHFPVEGNWCLLGALDPEKVKGKIVVCQRGSNGRVNKGEAVVAAGGVGMVLWNDNAKEGLITDIHALPALHVLYSDGLKIVEYVNSTQKPVGTISDQKTNFGIEAPAIIDFSSRGPIESPTRSIYPSANDILKPDVSAPGVSIWAGFSPHGDPRQFYFNLISGTSMASPHVAGIGALVKQAHPDWDPFWIKSAIQTTALVTNNRGNIIPGSPPTVLGTPFDYGSGQINPINVTDPGLVYPSKFEDYIGFLYYISASQALQLSGMPPPSQTVAPRDLNLPTIAISNLKGSATVSRTVINVGEAGSDEFTVSIDAPAGVKVSIEPKVLTVKRGESASFKVTFTVVDPSEEFVFGSFVWSNGHYFVRSTLAVQPIEQ